jgi:hypothetical protein
VKWRVHNQKSRGENGDGTIFLSELCAGIKLASFRASLENNKSPQQHLGMEPVVWQSQTFTQMVSQVKV